MQGCLNASLRVPALSAHERLLRITLATLRIRPVSIPRWRLVRMAHDEHSQHAEHQSEGDLLRSRRKYRNITVGDHASMIAGEVHGTVHFNSVDHRGILRPTGVAILYEYSSRTDQ